MDMDIEIGGKETTVLRAGADMAGGAYHRIDYAFNQHLAFQWDCSISEQS